MNDAASKYVSDQRTAGVSDDAIRDALVGSGYTSEQIDQLLVGVTAPPPPPVQSQTGAGSDPLQVENIQYNVKVKNYQSKPGIIFRAASVSLAICLFVTATLLYAITNLVFNFDDVDPAVLQVCFAIMIPTGVVSYLALKRLYKLFAEQPQAIEEIKFKTRLRRTFWTFLVLSMLGSVIAIFNFINLFVDYSRDVLQYQFYSLYYVGGAIVFTVWLYSLQKKTER